MCHRHTTAGSVTKFACKNLLSTAYSDRLSIPEAILLSPGLLVPVRMVVVEQELLASHCNKHFAAAESEQLTDAQAARQGGVLESVEGCCCSADDEPLLQ